MSSPARTTTTPLQILLDLIASSLAALLCSAAGVQCFHGRWQILRSKLSDLSEAISETSESPHWAENPLIHTLLPTILSTLSRLSSLSSRCSHSSAISAGKLLLQSDLEIASNSLSDHLRDLHLLLRSGVLSQTAIVLFRSSAGDDLPFFLADLFTRLQIGGLDFKRKALESLVRILDEDAKSASVIARHCDVACLVHLLDHRHLRDLAAVAVSGLAASGDEVARRAVFEEGALGPLLRIMESSSVAIGEKAARAVEAITSDPENAWAVTAYGGVSVLIEACRAGSPAAIGAIRNVANVEEARISLAEEGAVPVLLQILVSGAGSESQENSAGSLAILAASGENYRSLIIQERGLQRLVQVLFISSSSATEQILRAISALSCSDSAAKFLGGSTAVVVKLGELVIRGAPGVQSLAASLIGSLPISDGNKRAIGGSMASLVKLTESPKPPGSQEAATRALVALLSVRSNRKELARDEKSVTRLTLMLDPRIEGDKSLPVAIVAAIVGGGSSQGCRRRLVDAGVLTHLHSLAEIEVAGAKKTAQRLSGNRLKSIFSSRTWRE